MFASSSCRNRFIGGSKPERGQNGTEVLRARDRLRLMFVDVGSLQYAVDLEGKNP
jgi:hypothetical protein